MDLPEWFKIKKYPHIGIPPSEKDYKWIIKYITNEDKIKIHPFLPLIRRSVWVHKTKMDSGTGKKKWKERKLTYSSHFDALIYSYYAHILQCKYDNLIKENHLDNVAIAYRKIQTEENIGKNKCNIHFALDTFKFVKEKLNVNNELAFITFDITGFFDNLDHKLLKSSWTKVLDEKMSDDVYAVYKNVTKFSFVKEGPLFSLFKNNILCRCVYKTKSGKIKIRIKKKKISSRRFLREHEAIAFCEKSDLKIIRQHNLIEREKENEYTLSKKGIPQGLPISAVLANVYMFDFDTKVNRKVMDVGGIYKRYSDDIVVVCPYSKMEEMKQLILDEIDIVKLEIEPSKTNTFKISKDEFGNISCIYESGASSTHKEIEYLGFSFDGNRVMMKKAGICKYYTKMKKDVGRHEYWASNIKNKTKGNVFVNQLVRKFTFAGSKTYCQKDKNGKERIKHGNFLTYVKKASRIMNEPAILAQMSKNLNKINTAIANLQKRVDNKKNKKIVKKVKIKLEW